MGLVLGGFLVVCPGLRPQFRSTLVWTVRLCENRFPRRPSSEPHLGAAPRL